MYKTHWVLYSCKYHVNRISIITWSDQIFVNNLSTTIETFFLEDLHNSQSDPHHSWCRPYTHMSGPHTSWVVWITLEVVGYSKKGGLTHFPQFILKIIFIVDRNLIWSNSYWYSINVIFYTDKIIFEFYILTV